MHSKLFDGKGCEAINRIELYARNFKKIGAVRSGINYDIFMVNDREKKQVTSTIGSKKPGDRKSGEIATSEGERARSEAKV